MAADPPTTGESTGSGGTPTTPVFVLDVNLDGPVLRKRLIHAGLPVVSLAQHFPRDTPDVHWIPAVSAPSREWVIVTKGRGILERSDEFDALCDFAARLILFAEVGGAGHFRSRSDNLTAPEMAARFLAHLPAVLAVLASRPAPLVIVLYPDSIDVFPP